MAAINVVCFFAVVFVSFVACADQIGGIDKEQIIQFLQNRGINVDELKQKIQTNSFGNGNIRLPKQAQIEEALKKLGFNVEALKTEFISKYGPLETATLDNFISFAKSHPELVAAIVGQMQQQKRGN